MNIIAKILKPEYIRLDVDLQSKKRVFEQAGLLFEPVLGLSRRSIFEAFFARERLGSTGLGNGIAIPHGRVAGLKDTVGAFVRLKKPILFESPDNLPVDLLFLLLVSTESSEEHLQVLAALAEVLSQEDFRSHLRAAQTADEIWQLFFNLNNVGH